MPTMVRNLCAADAFTWVPLLLGVALGPALAASAGAQRLHVTEVNQRLLTPDEDLLLGNGDLSVSVYQTADRIIWRLGKGDVWDRRWDNSDDAPPLDIEEMRRGVGEEKWKAGNDQPITAENPTTTPERLKEVSFHAPSYAERPYPAPKPLGELYLQLPLNADLVNVQISQRIVIEEGRLEITYTWPNGRELKVESFIHPAAQRAGGALAGQGVPGMVLAVPLGGPDRGGVCGAASVYTRDLRAAQRFIDRVEAGLVHVNMHTAYKEPQLAFGGCKHSGTGLPEAGESGLQFFTHHKTVCCFSGDC